MASITQHTAVGRRKTSTARVYLRPGNGALTINHRTAEDYFPLEWRRNNLKTPFEVTATVGQFDVLVNASGGGLTGQAEAIRLGIARALVKYDEELKKPLPDARPSNGRAQKVRPAEGPQEISVFETLEACR